MPLSNGFSRVISKAEWARNQGLSLHSGRRKTPHLFDRTRAFTKVAPRAQGRTTCTSVLIAWHVPDEADEAPKIPNHELGRSYVGRWSTASNRDPYRWLEIGRPPSDVGY